MKKLNKTGRVALQRFLELTIPAVLLSVLFSLLLQWGIIRMVLPGSGRAVLMYYTPMLFAVIYAIGNAILMRRSRRLFLKYSGSHSETDENSKLTDDPKGYYIANYSALAAFAVLPFISRYVFDSIVFRWVFGITNWLRLAVIGLGYQHLNDVPVHASITVFILILAAMIPLAQINVRKNYIKNIEKKQKERKERLSTATKTTKEHREKGAKEKLDIYSMAAGNKRELTDEEKAKEEESIRLREKGRTEKLDIYSMAAGRKHELSDEEKAKEEESRRLREKGKQGPQRVDIYNMKKE